MKLIWIDYFFIAIIVISMLISLWRGFVREALSLAGWIFGVIIALAYMGRLAVLLAPKLSSLPPSLLTLLSFVILLISVVIVAAIINNLIATLVEKTGLSGTDRAIGLLFGIARGMVLVAVLVLLAGFTQLPHDPWWSQSLLIGHFQPLAVYIASFLPPDIAVNIHY